MTVKTLLKPSTSTSNDDKKAQDFIMKGGSSTNEGIETPDDHRLTLRIPKDLLEKIDAKRKERVGFISRNLWILEKLDQATKQ